MFACWYTKVGFYTTSRVVTYMYCFSLKCSFAVDILVLTFLCIDSSSNFHYNVPGSV
eukprot:m.273722 g.273722  ORF g.273722 m.273722 type:complete len:57 (+) comp40579_c0_seq33:50-220(+)